MSVKKEASGRRSVQVEVEVPGTPEEVWQAIATGPGISSWFVPAEFEERDGKPVAVTLNFGPGMESRSAVTAWDPPRMFAAQGEGWGGSPPIATEWSVEARAGGVCLVRVVHSLFASTDDWDNQLEATESGWPGFFRTLRIYLTHFRGQRSALMQFVAPVAGTEAEAWETLTAALGLEGLSVGQRWTAPAGVPAGGGVAEYVSQSPYDALLRLDKPGPGVAALGAFNMRRPEHGCAELLSLRRSGGRDRRPRDTAVASVDPGTLPDAPGVEQGRMTASSWGCQRKGDGDQGKKRKRKGDGDVPFFLPQSVCQSANFRTTHWLLAGPSTFGDTPSRPAEGSCYSDATFDERKPLAAERERSPMEPGRHGSRLSTLSPE